MDDLLDLTWQPSTGTAATASNPSKPTQQPTQQPAHKPLRPGYSAPNYHTSRPAASASPAPPASASAPKAESDAFSSLFAPTSSAKHEASLSLAQRQKLAQEQARSRADQERRTNDALWSGIDSTFAASSSSSSPSPAVTAAKPTPPSGPSAPAAAASTDPWDFDAFTSTPANPPAAITTAATPLAAKAQSKPRPNNDPFDFDGFESSLAPTQPTAARTEAERDASDDILGALAMPVSDLPPSSSVARDPRLATLSSSASTSSSSRDSSRVPSPASGRRQATLRAAAGSRPPSPPPHVIGQIVEMGFSPQQARQALARTSTGLDVHAALELLVGEAHTNDEHHEHHEHHEEHEEREVRERNARRRRHPDAARAPAGVQSGGEGVADWQQQADQLVAQASEIGSSVLTRASALWSSAKAQAHRALDERTRSTTPEAATDRHRARRWGTPAASARTKEWEGKPKWMLDAELASSTDSTAAPTTAANDSAASAHGGFKDSDDEADERARAQVVEPPRRRERQPAVPAAPAVGVGAAAAAVSSAANALFGLKPNEAVDGGIARQSSPARASTPAAAAKAGYASPNRRLPSRSAAASPHPTATVPSKTLVRRVVPSEPRETIALAAQAKEEGNTHFRLGAYSDAESSYTRGIAVLSPDSLHLLPLLSNRANVRLKNGDTPGTVADCDHLLRIILAPASPQGGQRNDAGRVAVYSPSSEAELPAELGEVKLRETFAKALVRRAQALEAREKWKLARADWSVLLEYEQHEGSGVKTAPANIRFAREGLQRCAKMLGESPPQQPPSAPRASTSTAPSARAPASKASNAARAAREPSSAGGLKSGSSMVGGGGARAYAEQQTAMAREESARFELKDGVDARIEAWRRGKETNLRALLSSLDSLVWPELGWRPIALHQILDPAALKKNYTKAIARLHPDKIPNTATTEQKMIATAAFHTLNEAWNANQP